VVGPLMGWMVGPSMGSMVGPLICGGWGLVRIGNVVPAVDKAPRCSGIEEATLGANLKGHSLATGLQALGVSLGEITGLPATAGDREAPGAGILARPGSARLPPVLTERSPT
jgi:hypothetical protein